MSAAIDAKHEHAAGYCENGMKLLILQPGGTKTPINLWRSGKKDGFDPAVLSGLSGQARRSYLIGFAASSDPKLVSAWLDQWPDAGLGIDCRESGLFVIDLDQHDGKDGRAALLKIAHDHHGFDVAWDDPGGPFGDPLRSRSPRGGEHLFYRAIDLLLDEPMTGAWATTDLGKDTLGITGLDIKWNGYVGVPNGDGRREWLNEEEPLPIPAWLLDEITKLRGPRKKAAPKEKVQREPRQAGEINHETITAAHLQKILDLRPAIDFTGNGAWQPLLMAAHHATGGIDETREIFVRWSIADPDYADAARLIRDRWDSLDPNAIGGFTVGTLYHFFNDGVPVSTVGAEDFDTVRSELVLLENKRAPVRGMKCDKTGAPKGTFENALIGLQALGLDLAHDPRHQRIIIRNDLTEIRKAHPVLDPIWNDAAHHVFRGAMISQFNLEVTVERVREAGIFLSGKQVVDAVADYLRGLTTRWDGIVRIDGWLIRYAGADDSPYVRAVGRHVLLGAVGRALQPGVKFDEMMVLEGKQGIGKSRLVGALAGGGEWVAEGLAVRDLHDRDAVASIIGPWIIEWPELAGMARNEIESIKGFLSKTQDRARLAYARTPQDYPRRCIFIGTTNEGDYLQDQTGNRRFLPVRTGAIDIESLMQVRDQLWAEAVSVWNGADQPERLLQFPKDAEPAAREEQEARRREDPWEGTVRDWLEGQTLTEVTGSTVLHQALCIEAGRQTDRDLSRLRKLMERSGWKHGVIGPRTRRVRGYKKCS